MAQFSNKALVATIRGISKNDSNFGKQQANLAVEALEGVPMTALYKGHAVRLVKRYLKKATKKDTIARLEAALAQVESVKTIERYAHAASLAAE